MLPYIFKIGDFPIRSFGLMVLLGVLAAAWWLRHAFKRLGIEDGDPVGQLVTRALIYGFIGARLLYLALHGFRHDDAFANAVSIIAIWEGGLVSYGGFLGGAFGAWMFARKRKAPLLRVGDAVLPGLILGQVLGRIGCFLVGDDHGHPWDGPWAVVFPPREGSLVQPEYIVDAVPLHPSQLYLSLMNLVIFLVAARMFARRRFDGQVSAFVIMAYAVGRFCVEYTRGDDVARGWIDFGPLQLFTSQWISVVMVFIGAAMWLSQRKRPEAQIGTAA